MGAWTSMWMWHFSVYAHSCCRVQQLLGRAGNHHPAGLGHGSPHSAAAQMLLALGECHHELMTWCQSVPTTYPGVPILPPMNQEVHGGCPREQGYMLLQSCTGPAGHHWHLGVPLCLPTALGESRALVPPPRARDPGTYAAFSRRRNTTCLASCSAPGRKGGEPITPVPPSTSPQPPAASRAWPLPPSCGHP